jgi:(Z)-2-((N-methylformamido)methylene)-5-hydroxybutyrolactone dehydrogenase
MLQAERAEGHFIDGKLDGGAGGESLTVWRPATGEPLGSVPVASETDVDRAVRSAADAFSEWRTVSAFEREAMLTAIADLIAERRTELAELECANTGKRPSVGLAEVDGAAEVFRFYAGYPTKERGTHIDGGEPDVLRYTRLEPLGVVGAITPWNYPLLIATVKVAAALAAGCTVVLKPAPETPLTSIALAQIVSDAGLPGGTLNVVTGDGASGHHVASHPGVAKVTFTGSTATGRKVAVAAGQNARPVTMELGGKSPNIVFDDVDLDAVVTPVLMGALANSGQECCAGARILVQQGVYDAFVERAAARMETFAVGADDDAEVGPLISERQRERVSGFVDRAREAGAVVRAQGATPSEGFYFPPTLIADIEDDMEACREEIFGPVVTVQRFDTDDDALRMGNDTRYGLAAGIWSRSIDRALRFSRELEAGQVWINAYLNGGTLMPFGGAKDSGFGRELGLDGPAEFTYVKSVAIADAPARAEGE